MQKDHANLFTRPDTLFGVCQGLGQDLGINPIWLRLAFPLPLFFYPVATVAGYFALGMLVLLTRLVFPNPRMRQAEAASLEAAPAMPELEAETTPEPEAVPLAA